MRPYLVIAICLLICGCSIKSDITGKYTTIHNPNYLYLKQDSTFIYEFRSMHLYQHSIGTWQKKDKTHFVLNSDIKSTSIPLTISVVNNKNTYNNISVELIIKGSQSLADYQCWVYINNKPFCKRRCDSLASISVPSAITNLYFVFIKAPRLYLTSYVPYPLLTNKYIPSSVTGNNLKVQVSFSDNYFYYKAFDNELIEARGNSIWLFNSLKSKWDKLLKVSDSTNLFSRYKDQSKELNLFRN